MRLHMRIEHNKGVADPCNEWEIRREDSMCAWCATQ